MTTCMAFQRTSCPSLARVVQRLPVEHIVDVRAETRERLLGAGLRERVRPGASIAITAGSRGMGGFQDLLRGVADAVKQAGGQPFIIPAMGSHGGAVAQGQIEILRCLGVTEESIGAPVRATMETVELDAAASGAVAHLDRCAFQADGIIVLGRTKIHPDSTGPIASGLLKMVTIGLGKQSGAQSAHSHGLWESVRTVPQIVLAKANILFGVAVVENGYRQPVAIEAVPGDYDAFLEADKRLLTLSKAHLGEVPFEELDLLIIDEVGKNITGSGIELNVIGHWRLEGGPKLPNFRRIAALSLTAESLGNGIGIGLADFTTQRFADAYDPCVTYVNILTSLGPKGNPGEGPLPLALPSDRDAIEVALYSALPQSAPRVCRIRNTAALDEMWVSPSLLDAVKAKPRFDVLTPPEPLPFDEAGNLF